MQKDFLVSIVKKKKIAGRGRSSGLGKTCGRGQKGQKSRKSGHVRVGFEGGQTPIYRRFPKVGFVRKKAAHETKNLLNFFDNNKIKSGDIIDFSSSSRPVKILGMGKVNKKIVIKAHKFSKKAIEKITEAGGE
jgi:large subunit ribosomal protein L15